MEHTHTHSGEDETITKHFSESNDFYFSLTICCALSLSSGRQIVIWLEYEFFLILLLQWKIRMQSIDVSIEVVLVWVRVW